ncbi:hypothetical protein SFBM_0356 [Candidatus Arthromitus sp. SFB-mouse-Japan]|uniref:DUF368 domain-containing protein n=1 Tax=unclassified Candidatus Neoarthromitus TaxID=2638829 RepID=UPI00021B7DFA|nr:MULTISPECIES: DUF368 domain-containing protein [unclassified Candidatus Arthromitus]EIA29177.1 hypothetical protein SFB6_014G37 [Candidatus Arthromitus sp. SFB-co]EIA29253.1 hypothetical protein SFB5_086G2 [Candidatus Arthromitus sp. SFB-5]EIA29519.1 hypothetical protein SFB4_061G5 [Candidatus Arthromitus sp. SFB-4]EIA30402.1 hypothetical protein SFBSU_006G83 [Candidatus Arthromitus sp. SFB-mouse-SU]AID44297.1 Hypothetical protein SFBmNL_00379 [Candidatus Arthromitus sp. SFB-mouse-NL]
MGDLRNILNGVVLGVSNIIPGVSAGTMLVVLGIYDKLIKSISTIFCKFKENFRFLFFLGLGILLGILLFSNILSYFLDRYPWQMNYLFMGLILGTFGILFKTVKDFNPNKLSYTFFLITFLILIGIRFMDISIYSRDIIDELSLRNAIMLFASGFVAASAMVIPGLSGSFILIVFGVYNSIIVAVSELNILILIPFGVGVILGFLCMIRVIEYLLKAFKIQTYMGILGLVTGSLVLIFPGFEFSMVGLTCILSLILGFAISYFMCKIDGHIKDNRK